MNKLAGEGERGGGMGCEVLWEEMVGCETEEERREEEERCIYCWKKWEGRINGGYNDVLLVGYYVCFYCFLKDVEIP